MHSQSFAALNGVLPPLTAFMRGDSFKEGIYRFKWEYLICFLFINLIIIILFSSNVVVCWGMTTLRVQKERWQFNNLLNWQGLIPKGKHWTLYISYQKKILTCQNVDPKSVWVGNVQPDTKNDPHIAAAQNVLYSTCNTRFCSRYFLHKVNIIMVI